MKKKLLIAILILVVGIQFVPVDRTNPPVTRELHVEATTAQIFRRACYDCHSNETNWPWYSYVAPVSWLVARDVHQGRRELNFSEWGTYSARRADHKLEEIVEKVEKGEMPLPIYLPLHPEARLAPQDVEQIARTVQALRAQLKAEAETDPEAHEDRESHDDESEPDAR